MNLMQERTAAPSEGRDDTKHLNKVMEFDGDRGKWSSFTFKFVSYLLALDERYEQFIAKVASTDDEQSLYNVASHGKTRCTVRLARLLPVPGRPWAAP